jgi:hypothetical protein
MAIITISLEIFDADSGELGAKSIQFLPAAIQPATVVSSIFFSPRAHSFVMSATRPTRKMDA